MLRNSGTHNRWIFTFSLVGLMILSAGTATAQWSLISDFEGLTPGPLGTQGGWNSAPLANYDVTADPDDAANQTLSMTNDNGNAYISLGAGIADGTTSTLFFRGRVNNPADFVFGASDVAAPGAWGDYEGYMRFANGSLDVRNGGGFTVGGAYATDVWTNIWVVLDNATDMSTLYASTGSNPAMLLASGAFRNGTTAPLTTVNLRAGGNHVGNFGYLDDVYLSAGTDLTNPVAVPEPAGIALLLLGMGVFFKRRR